MLRTTGRPTRRSPRRSRAPRRRGSRRRRARFGLLPPSSSVSRLIGSEHSRMISPPVFVEPVNATLSTPGCRTRYAPVVGPSPGTMLIAPAREADLGRELGEAQHRQRRLRVGLEHDGAARCERGRELPGRHQQRVVPRHDLRGDADRLLLRVEEQRAADRVRAAGDRRRSRRRRSGSSRSRRRSRP